MRDVLTLGFRFRYVYGYSRQTATPSRPTRNFFRTPLRTRHLRERIMSHYVALCPRVCYTDTKISPKDYTQVVMQNCLHCSYQNPEGTKFCQQCGYPLIPPAPIPLAQTAHPEPVPQMPTFTEEELGPKKGLTHFEKWALVGSVLVIILIIGVFASMSYSPSRTAPVAPPTPAYTPSWHAVTSFAGSGDEVTDTFHINGTRFRLRWQYATDFPQYSIFYVWVYERGRSIAIDYFCWAGGNAYESCERILNSSNAGTQQNFWLGGPGDFHLSIWSVNLDWRVAIEDYY